MHKVKVVHVTQSLGGVKTYIEHILNYSNAATFEYIVIAPEHSEFQAFCQEKSLKYYPIKIQRNINPFKDLLALYQLISLLRKEKPDVVHTHSAKGGFLGRLAAKFVSAKIIYSPHAFSFLPFRGVKRLVFYFLEFLVKGWTDILLSVSYSEANRAIFEVGYKENKVRTILNAVPLSDDLPFRNYSICKKVGMIGRLTYQKNPLLFLEVAAKLLSKYPFLEFSILGAGLCDHLSKEIEDYLTKNKLKDKIQILNWGENKAKKFLAETDVFVMTSVFEGLPFSLIEAMSLGIPCVVSKVDGNTDVVQNYENGFACLSTDEFCKKIALLIENETVRRKIGQAGYRYVKETHDIKNNIKQLESLYLQLTHMDGLISINKIRESTAEQKRMHLKVSPNI